METLEQEKNALMDEPMLDSEDEQDRVEEEKEKFTNTLTFTVPLPAQVNTILVCAPGTAYSLSKIIFFGKIKEIGKAETLYHEKTIETLKVFYVEASHILVVHPESSLKSLFAS